MSLYNINLNGAASADAAQASALDLNGANGLPHIGPGGVVDLSGLDGAANYHLMNGLDLDMSLPMDMDLDLGQEASNFNTMASQEQRQGGGIGGDAAAQMQDQGMLGASATGTYTSQSQQQEDVKMTGAGAGPLPTGFGMSVAQSTSTLTEFTKRRNWSQRIIEELKDFLHILTPDGRILYVSPSCKAMTGY